MLTQFATLMNVALEGQRRVLPPYYAGYSSTGFTSLLAALIVETGIAIDSGPSEFGRAESARWKWEQLARAVTWDVLGCRGVWNRF